MPRPASNKSLTDFLEIRLEARQNRPFLSPFGSPHALPAQGDTTVGIISVTITEIRFSLWNMVRYEIFTNLIDKGVNSGYNK